jgi:hypothetical protein
MIRRLGFHDRPNLEIVTYLANYIAYACNSKCGIVLFCVDCACTFCQPFVLVLVANNHMTKTYHIASILRVLFFRLRNHIGNASKPFVLGLRPVRLRLVVRIVVL